MMGTENHPFTTSLTPSMQRAMIVDANCFYRDSAKPVPPDRNVRDAIDPYLIHADDMHALYEGLKKEGYGARRVASQLIETLQVFSRRHEAIDRNFDPHYRKAKERAEAMLQFTFTPKILTYSSDEDVMDAMTRKDTSTGFDRYVTGWRHKGECIGQALKFREATLSQALRSGTFGTPIRCFDRQRPLFEVDAQLRVIKTWVKCRLVEAVSLRVILSEMRFCNRFQSAMQTKEWYATGKTPFVLRQIVDEVRRFGQNWVSIDYSKYDQSLPGWLIRDAFGIIYRSMHGERWSTKERREWDIMVHDFIIKDFIGPEGKLVHAEDGVPSGSRWTNVIDSLCNLMMLLTYQEWCHDNAEEQLRDLKCCICGDDNLIGYKGELNLTQMAEYMSVVFGTCIKAEKCKCGTRLDPPQFLSAEWRWGGPWRDPAELYARMIWPENYRDYKANPDLDPYAIIAAYIECYPLGMADLMDVRRFKMDHGDRHGGWADTIKKQLPGVMRYTTRYLNVAS